MNVLYFVLALIALFCFAAAALMEDRENLETALRKSNLMAAGLFLFALITTLQLYPGLPG